jgi:23S rRNA-/tRNA-specific pseudouridylate synthase
LSVWEELEHQIREKAKTGFDIYSAIQYAYRTLRDQKWVRVDDVLELLNELKQDYNLTPKPEEWEEEVADAFWAIHNKIKRDLQTKGIHENEDLIVIDKKQDKYVILEREKLLSLFYLLIHTKWSGNVELDRKAMLKIFSDYFPELQKKFEEVTGKNVEN